MERSKKKNKSKTPMRGHLHLAPDEIKDLRVNLLKLGNSSEGLTERTMLTESPEKQIMIDDSALLDEYSITLLRDELEAKTKIIGSMRSNQNDLIQSIKTLKAQNLSLHKELNSCRSKSYDLDVELYLAKEEICAKDKELESIRVELKNLQLLIKNSQNLKEENLSLKEEIQSLKVRYERKLAKEKEKNDDVGKLATDRQGNGFGLDGLLNKGVTQEFRQKNLTKSADRGLNLDYIRISRKFQTSSSPQKFLNQTDRPGGISGSLLSDLQIFLSVDQPHKILSSVVHMMENSKSLKKYKKFFSSLADLVIECSPAGAFVAKPKPKQVWAWITRLLEEYMKLKKVNEL